MIKGQRIVYTLLVILSTLSSTSLFAQGDTIRDWDEERVSFWLQIYTRYDSTETVVHDNIYPHIIYEVLRFTTAGDMSIDKRQKIIDETILKYQNILNKFSRNETSYQQMNTDEWRVYNLFKPINDVFKFNNAASRDRIRVQDGRRDSFLAGLIRSGRYADSMKSILRTAN